MNRGGWKTNDWVGMSRKRVLITGAAGRIGKACARDLRERYDLRLMYHRTPLEEDFGQEVVQGAANDLERMEEIVDGMDAIIHMAGNPRVGASWDSILESNIVGLYCLYEAAHRRQVPRIVFASSNHATGFYEQEGTFTTVAMPARPATTVSARCSARIWAATTTTSTAWRLSVCASVPFSRTKP